MKNILLFILFLLKIELSSQSCTALFSYGAQFEKVCFSNVSTVSNAHYYWNFGDGTSTNIKNPCHDFFENGNYLVTLYALDSIANCSSYYQQWIQVTKYSTDPCNPFVMDSIYTDAITGNKFLKIVETGTNCSNYSKWYRFGGSGAGSTYFFHGYPYHLVCSASYGNPNFVRAAFKTCVSNFDFSKNYKPCSANFEFSVVSEDTVGQTIFFKAMNKNAASYQWFITGLGSPIIFTTDTMSYHLPGFDWNWQVYLFTKGQSGCRDSTLQQVNIRKKSVTYVGVKERKDRLNSVKMFPNPAKNKLKIEIENIERGTLEFELHNCIGELILSKQTNEQEVEFDLSILSKGFYFLKVSEAKTQRVFKVIKE